MFVLLTVAFAALTAGLAPRYGTDSRPDFSPLPDRRPRGI
ncbi:unannotated protein [freshwater metagenome]|uniref:Unannotated protein n=1 Tax=freshwater metagenome TaxID=449393 RepID=A0A6J7DPY3_9ZZZZ